MAGHLQHESFVDGTSWPCRKEMLNAVFRRGDLSSFCAERELTHRAKMKECQAEPRAVPWRLRGHAVCLACLCCGAMPGALWGPLCCLSV